MKKITILLVILGSMTLIGCNQNPGPKYTAVNRQRALMLIDNQTGEVFMMELKTEKGKGIVGSKWRKMGSPSDAN